MVLNLFFILLFLFMEPFLTEDFSHCLVMVGHGGMQRKFRTAVDEVFANGDLVCLFKGCFTLCTFILNKKFVRFARKKQVDIVPVAVRANVDLLAYQKASRGSLKLKVCDIEFPAHLDPTLDMHFQVHLIDSLMGEEDRDAKFQADVHCLMELNIMAKMLETHAAALRRLKIHMSLDVELSDDVAKAPLYKHIHKFLQALSKCTALKTLIIVQSDHIEKNATANSVQRALFNIIKTMQLEILDYNGNMTIDAGAVAPQSVVTLIDYIPPSLRKLIVRDGPEPRMFKWQDDQGQGISSDIKWVMSNHDAKYSLLKSIYLPSSFWSLSTQKFSGFMVALNANHITHIGFSDAFQLNTRPTAQTGGGVVNLRKPKYMLHFLIANLIQDMVIDLRGSDDAERAVRIMWVIQITTSSVVQPIHRSDGGGYTTITMHKVGNCTVQVLI